MNSVKSLGTTHERIAGQCHTNVSRVLSRERHIHVFKSMADAENVVGGMINLEQERTIDSFTNNYKLDGRPLALDYQSFRFYGDF